MFSSPDNSSPMERRWVDDWLSVPRFDAYMSVCGDDVATALALYEWNISLCQVLLKDLSHFEVALRNAYDRALDGYWHGSAHWLFDNDSPVRRPIMRRNAGGNTVDVNRLNRKQIQIATGSLSQPATPDCVVSNLTLGFWAHMTDRSHERDLWIPVIHCVWPRGTNRKDLHRKIQSVNALRNRVAHHEHLFNPGDADLSPARVDEMVVGLFRELCPEAAEWAYMNSGMTPVTRFIDQCPPPAQVAL